MNMLDVVVHAIRLEAAAIHSFELRSATGGSLPRFFAGAHIDVHLQHQLVRSYSIANSPDETDRYVIVVKKEPAGRGGSRYMHEQVRVGQTLQISEPRNNFDLNEQAANTVLIAGGIGITPLLSMIERLIQISNPWILYYCGRDTISMAFLGRLKELARDGADVRLHIDSESPDHFLDMGKLVAQSADETHFYCCGPASMLTAFDAATEHLPRERVHVEYFVAREEADVGGGFVVQLARSNISFRIAPGKSILDTLIEAGFKVDFSCMDGICGSCETRVLAGTPKHRDSILSKAQRAANDRMMICCSGSQTPKLVLDL